MSVKEENILKTPQGKVTTKKLNNTDKVRLGKHKRNYIGHPSNAPNQEKILLYGPEHSS